MRAVSITRQLEDRRAEVGSDHRFVMRCHDGAYGRLATEIALDVVARESVDGQQPPPESIADAIITEALQTERDALPAAA